MNLSRIKIGLYEQAERIVGKQAIDRMYLDRCIKIYRKQQVIFIHIPKAAGTSVARAVLGKRAGHFTAETVRDRMGNDPYYKLYSFAVTRHPVDRLYSAYRYVKGNGGTEGAFADIRIMTDPYSIHLRNLSWNGCRCKTSLTAL